MRTAIVSDLHLGSAFGEDIARDPAVRRELLEEIAGADRLVLLGDAIEMRELPLSRALEAARPFFEELGEAMAGRPVAIVPGNHDHRLAEPLLEAAAIEGRQLGLEQTAPPRGEPAERIAGWLGDAETSIAYPGIWLRDDVYATHGHYMDCHMRLPRLECVLAATSMRLSAGIPERAAPADYERVLRPLYGFSFGLAQGGLARRASRPSERAWRAVAGNDRRAGPVRRALVRAAAGAGIPATVWSVNRLLRSEFDADLSPGSITRSGVDAAATMADRLDIGAAHTITGHTHRGGPGDGDDGWTAPGGGRLHNTGSWVFASAFHRPGTPPGPYWPGTVTWVEESGPPRRVRLLHDRTREQLKATVAALAS